jgi:hypothetical protein
MQRLSNFISFLFRTKLLSILSFIYGAFTLIRDEFLPVDLATKLRLGGMFSMIDWYWFIIAGLVFWLIDVGWRATNKDDAQNNPGVAARRDINGPVNLGHGTQIIDQSQHKHFHGDAPKTIAGLRAANRAAERHVSPPSWDRVEFVIWNPSQVHRAHCGIEIINNKRTSLNYCYSEILNIYELRNQKYKHVRVEPPHTLAWIINNKDSYEKIEIEPTKHKYVGLVFGTSWTGINGNYKNFYAVLGKDFSHNWPEEISEMIVEVEISGKIDNNSITPKKLFATIFRTGNEFTVTEVTDVRPENIQ